MCVAPVYQRPSIQQSGVDRSLLQDSYNGSYTPETVPEVLGVQGLFQLEIRRGLRGVKARVLQGLGMTDGLEGFFGVLLWGLSGFL